MPKINQYKDGRGYYIRSKFDDVMVTYQVSPKGEEYLRKKRLGAGSVIKVNDLIWMQKKGYVYTHGSGPSEVDTPLWTKPSQPPRPKRTQFWPKPPKSQPGCACCSAAVMMAVVSGAAVLGTAVGLYRHR